MMKFAQAIAVSALLSLASAQYAINPKSVSSADRQQWCVIQETSCPLICLDTDANSAETKSNDCNADTLTYAFVCSNGLSPNISEYSQTLPFFICQTWGSQCQSNCNGNTLCQTDCVEKHPCGAQHPKRVNGTSNSTTSSSSSSETTSLQAGASSASGGVVFTGLGGSGSPAPTQGNAVAAAQSAGGASSVLTASVLNASRTFGLLGVMGALFGGFAVLL